MMRQNLHMHNEQLSCGCPDCRDTDTVDKNLLQCRICGLGKSINVMAAADEQDYLQFDEGEVINRRKYFVRLYDKYIKSGLLQQGRSLDVGCAGGLLVEVMQQYGWAAHGLDSYKNFQDDNMTFFRGTLDTFHPEHKYDLITLVHSFEHMDDPVAALNRIADLLSVNGRVLIVVPNFGGAWSQLTGMEWPMLNLDHHRYHYTVDSLSAVLKRAGYSIQTMNTYSGYFSPSVWQIRLARQQFYDRGIGSMQPLRSILFRINSLLRLVLNTWLDIRGTGAEIQVVASRP